MADTHETIADIIAEMRRRIAVKMSDAWYTQEEWRKLCDRLEAAWKRERGDVAKLREALVRVLDWLKRMNAQPLNTLAVSELTPSYAVNRTAKSIIEDNDYHISQLTAALSAPPRNCDRLNVDDAFEAFTFMCDNTDCRDCPYKQNNKYGDRELCAMLFLYDNGNGGKEGVAK